MMIVRSVEDSLGVWMTLKRDCWTFEPQVHLSTRPLRSR